MNINLSKLNPLQLKGFNILIQHCNLTRLLGKPSKL